MSGMIERLARSMARSCGEDPDRNAGFLLEPDRLIWQNYIRHARSGMEVMREPTKRMIDRAVAFSIGGGDPSARSTYMLPAEAAELWKLEIDEELRA